MDIIWLIVIVFIVLALLGSPPVGLMPHEYGWGVGGFLWFIVICLVIFALIRALSRR